MTYIYSPRIIHIMSKMPDKVLVLQALQGDKSSFRQIVEQTQSMVYNVAYRFLRNQHDAEDISQEVYLRLFKNLKNYNPTIKLSTWLYTITTNCCLDVLKSSARKQQYTSLDQMTTVESPDQAQLSLERFELHELILNMAERLTPVQKAVFILRDLENLSLEEVSNILSMRSNNVKSNLYYARKRMSELLTPYKSNVL